jgi:hypothetical protein
MASGKGRPQEKIWRIAAQHLSWFLAGPPLLQRGGQHFSKSNIGSAEGRGHTGILGSANQQVGSHHLVAWGFRNRN